MANENQMMRTGCLAVGGLVVLILLLRFTPVAVIPSGCVGVMTVFGRVTGQVVHEGVNIVSPLAVTHVMTVRTQEVKESASVPSKEGLILTMDTSLLFHLDPTKASDVFQKVGENYQAVIVEPNLRSAIRDATADNSANALYTGGRELVAEKILEELRTVLGPRGVIIENVLLRDIQLPDTLKAAIEAKQKAEQDSLQMQYVLTKEKQEADRKRVEAQGISDFQKIVTQGISEQLLQWKGIEATEKLANSPNAKVVIIGAGKSGMPLIMAP